MKQFLLLLCVIFVSEAEAQTDLVFNKHFLDCENRWVAFRMNKDSSYAFGFIYIDEAAGLTIDHAGSFKINDNNIFVPTKNKFSLKARLTPNNVTVALIPASRFKELQVNTEPDWLKFYKPDTTSVSHLTRWGWIYNDYGESAKALSYLERAQKIDPKYKGLEFELSFAYNALGQYEKAIPVLEGMIKDNPGECNNYKELVFAQAHSHQLNKAAETYKAGLPNCTEAKVKAEIAYNITQGYFMAKDRDKFKYWSDETKKWAENNSIFTINLTKMEAELAQ